MVIQVNGTVHKVTKRQLKEDIKRLRSDLKEKARLAEERLNQLKYLQADFDNYRKRFDKEKRNIIKLANENLIKELLVILDDFERALQQNVVDKEGLRLLYKNFLKILENHGLKKIDAIGEKFDPYYHEAVLREKSNKDDNVILEELQKGYMLNSKVIRHSKVKVAENSTKQGGDRNDRKN